jgi:hypothetical protein
MLIHPCLVARSLYAINVLVLVLIAVSSPQPSDFSIFGAIPDVCHAPNTIQNAYF